MKKLFFILFTLLFSVSFLVAAETQIKYGISETSGAEKKRNDFMQSFLAEFYRKDNIEATLFPEELLHKRGVSKKELDNIFQQFHVLNIRPSGEGLRIFDAELQVAAKTVSAALQDYVKAGGGLIVQLRPARYPNSNDAKYWNAVFAPLGMEVDNNYGLTSSKNVTYQQKPGNNNEFFFTDAIQKHKITEDVKGLWLPVNSFNNFPACPLIKYSQDYTFPVTGGNNVGTYFCSERTRGEFVSGKTQVINSNNPLPVIAVRQFGKGFIISISVDMIHTGMNFNNPVWSNITEEKGLNGKRSDMMKLMKNAVVFAAEPAIKNKQLGTYVIPKHTPVEFPDAVYWENNNFQSQPGSLVYGVIGAHTTFSDGKSSVEEYVKAAKKAGLQFIVFADPIDKLSPEKTEQLKAECKKYSDEDFFACPGMEFIDGSNLKRFVFGERIKHPGTNKFRLNKWEYPIFDGKKVQNAGYFILSSCSFSSNGFLDANDFPANKVHMENLWWFWASIPYVFEKGKLIADNSDFGKKLLHDMRLVIPITFDRIYSANEIQKSKNTAVTGGYSLPLIKKMLNSSNGYFSAENANLFCSYGNGGALKVNSFRFINPQEDPRRLHTRGTQRVRGYFNVTSPNGIKEVKIIDRNQGAIRVFDGKGEKTFEKEFELVHDKQYYVFLEVEDMKGCKLISNFVRVYDYKQGLYRCMDNMNILGPLGICWHPNWPEKISIYKYFRNSELLSVQGWDRASGDVPRPKMQSMNTLLTEEKGNVYPANSETTDGVVINVKLNSGDIQIVESEMDEIVERFANSKRGQTWAPSPPRVLSENEYFSHHQKVYYLRDRQDFHIAWDHRRLRESLKDYDGAMCLVTGEIKFRKNITLSTSAPIPFIIGKTLVDPGNLGRQDSTWIVKDAEKGFISQKVSKSENKTMKGQIASEGFVSSAWSVLGSLAIFPVSDSGWRYNFINSSTLNFGFGTPGKQYKEGDSIKYAFVSANVISDSNKLEKYKKLSALIHGQYPNNVKIGKKIKEPLFLHLSAESNEVKFTIGAEKGLGIDLPIKVSGLHNNGCAAIYSTKRPYFRFIGIADGENTAYTQEPMDEKNDIWIGNIFTADNKDLKLTLVADGRFPGANTFLEIHNPTSKTISAVISSPANTPVFGGKSFKVKVPAKSSVKKQRINKL